MASTKSSPEREEPTQQVFSESDAKRLAQQHVAALRKLRRPLPAEARALWLPRLRRFGRRLTGEAERLALTVESLWYVMVTPHHRLGRLLRRLWLTLRSWVNPPLFLALAAFALVTLSRYGPLPFIPAHLETRSDMFSSAPP